MNSVSALIHWIILSDGNLKKLIDDPHSFHLFLLLLLKLNIWFYSCKDKNDDEINSHSHFEAAFDRATLIIEKSLDFFNLESYTINRDEKKMSFIFQVILLRFYTLQAKNETTKSGKFT